MSDTPAPLPPAPFHLIDENHDGIDDRVVRYFGPLARLMETTKRFFSAPPPAPPALQPPPLPTITATVTALVSIKYSKVPYPSAIARDGDGLEYRVVPARDLAAKMDVSPNVLAIAAALVSECGPGKNPWEEMAIAEAIQNDAAAINRDACDRVTNETVMTRRKEGGPLDHVPYAGHFSHQSFRWCASIQQPTAHHLEAGLLSVQCFATGHYFTGGARRWIHLRSQDWMHRKNPKNADAEAMVKSRYAEGWRMVDPIVDGAGRMVLHPWDDCALFSKNRVPTMSETEALGMVTEGRNRHP